MNYYKVMRWLLFSPAFLLALLALAIVAPLFASSGDIITLNFPGSLNWHVASYLYGLEEGTRGVFTHATNTAWVALLIKLLEPVAPLWVLERLWIFLALWLSGVGAARLPLLKGAGRYYAGAVYMVNPFAYTRVAAGDWTLLTAYALLPFAVNGLVGVYRGGSVRNAAVVALLLSLMAVLHLQVLLLAVAVLVVLLLFLTVTSSETRWAGLRLGGMSLALFLLLNAYWLVPFFTGARNPTGLSSGDLATLGPKVTSEWRALATLTTLQGYWRDSYAQLLSLSKLGTLIWPIILFIAISGATGRLGDRTARPVLLAAVVGAIGGLLLSLGWDSKVPGVSGVWRSVLLPLGFWDTSAFLGLLALGCAYLGGIGVVQLQELGDGRRRAIALGFTGLAALAVGIPILYTLPMFRLPQVMQPNQFPRDWYAVRERLMEQPHDSTVLVLPWHLYMDYSWLKSEDKALASPASFFFSRPILTSDTVSPPPIFTQPQSEPERYIEFLLDRRYDVTNLGDLLAPLNVEYVLLLHEADYKDYAFLYRQADLKVELDLDTVTLFRNLRPISSVYGVNGLLSVRNWTEFVAMSRGQDVTDSVYPLEEATRYVAPSGMEHLSEAGGSPITVPVKPSSSRWTVFATPPRTARDGWRLNGRGPIAMNLGLTPVFSETDGGRLTYVRFFYLYVPLYVLSGLGLALSLAMLLSKWSRKHDKRRGAIDRGSAGDAGLSTPDAG
ncbi:MAG: hypothetical protein Q8P22_00795 [Chloroflexota bacterium]|nr:hypothetical protein [Chloroflexota bacterium]